MTRAVAVELLNDAAKVATDENGNWLLGKHTAAFLSGAAAGLFASVLVFPLDVIKVRWGISAALRAVLVVLAADLLTIVAA